MILTIPACNSVKKLQQLNEEKKNIYVFFHIIHSSTSYHQVRTEVHSVFEIVNNR